jgi:hypothetical protein
MPGEIKYRGLALVQFNVFLESAGSLLSEAPGASFLIAFTTWSSGERKILL